MLKFHRSNDELPEVAVTISNETVIRVALLTTLLIILFFAVRRAEHALLLIFVAFFLTIALNAPVYWISRQIPGKRRGSRAVATTLSFLFVIVVLGVIIAGVIPPLVKQTDNLIKAAPHLVTELRSQNGSIGKFIRHYHLQKQINTFSSQLSTRLQHGSGSAFDTAKHVGSSIFSLLTILVLTFMMLVEGPKWLHFAKDILPDKHHRLADRMGRDMYKVVRGYVNGQVILAALASILIMPAVLLLHINYPAAIMVIIFICGLIPLIGHTIGAAIVTIVAAFHSPTSALIILVYYWLYILIENYIIQPKIQSNTTNMSPLLVFASVIIGLSFGGIFGGLVAIPIAGCIRIIVLEYLYSKKIIDGPEFKQATTPDTK
jgi:predicted PurR-regulated permease PerM